MEKMGKVLDIDIYTDVNLFNLDVHYILSLQMQMQKLRGNRIG